MVLKTTNYNVTAKGVTMPEAYAYIRKISIENNSGVAEFAIQSTRENAQKLTAMDTVKVHFKVNREENPYVTAYNVAKGITKITRTNKRTGKTETREVKGPFFGWTDDYVDGEVK